MTKYMTKKRTHILSLTILAISGLLAFSCTREKGKFLDVDVTETITLPGLQGRVEMARDEWGVPHIYAENDHDLFYIQGYVRAKDRLFEMLILRGAARGHTAFFAGPSGLSTDVSVRVFKFGTVGDQMYSAASTEEKSILDAYADGVNDYMKTVKQEDLPFELLGRGITDLSMFNNDIMKWKGADSLAFGRLTSFQLSWDDEGTRGTQFQTINGYLTAYYLPLIGSSATPLAGGMTLDLFTPTATRGSVISLTATYGSGAPVVMAPGAANIGEIKSLKPLRTLLNGLFGPKQMSNNWAVDKANSATGNALLANDPHLSLDQPSIWHESHLNNKKQGGTINIAGVMFPPDPGVIIGFTDKLAWGETVVGYDVTDFYLERTTVTTTTPIPTTVMHGLPPTIPVAVTTRMETFMYLPESSLSNPCSLDNVKDEEDRPVVDGIKADFPVDVGTPVYFAPFGVCTIIVTYYEVPGHGPVVKVLPKGQAFTDVVALVTSRWTGLEPSTELQAFEGYWRATNIDEFQAAARSFSVGAQNQLVATTAGDIGWFPMAWVPNKNVAACSAQSIAASGGKSPGFPYLPQLGFVPACDWGYGSTSTYISLDALPQLKNPANGYIVTANNAPLALGPTAGNPPTVPAVPYYHGTYYDIGYRASRIGERIKNILASGSKVSVNDMMSIQADTYLGPCKDFLPLLTATVGACFISPPAAYCPATMPSGADDAFEYLESWDCSTPSGFDLASGVPVEVTDPTVRYNSAAAAVFHAWYGNFIHDTFDDQNFGQDVGGDMYGRAIYNITFRPNCGMLGTLGLPATTPCQLTGTNVPFAVPPTFPTSYYSPFWDDISTLGTTETRETIILRAFTEAVQALAQPPSFDPVKDTLLGGFGTSNVDSWLWGKLHTVITRHLAGESILNVPTPFDRYFPSGFPRPGGNFVVDASEPGVAKATVFPLTQNIGVCFTSTPPSSCPRSFTYSGGPSVRMVVDLDPNGVKAWTAITGGESARPSSAYYDDQMRQLWMVNKYKRLWFSDKDVVDHAQSLTVFHK